MFDFISSSSVVGFSGSRRPCSVCASALLSFLPSVSAPSVFVCDCVGVDALVRSFFPSSRLRLFSVASRVRWAFASRSASFVRSLASVGGVLVSFPCRPCPVGLAPSPVVGRCFCGLGSGSWAEICFAVGLGVPVLVFLGSVPAPSWLRPVSDGWFVSSSVSLFS